MKPFFSIITVTKDAEKKIDLTIKSVLSQNFKNFEYIIVDGYSSDTTFKKITRYKNNKKIRILRRRDKNFYDGLNFAISKTKGNYISILNSGDIFFSTEILKKIKKNILKYINFDFYFSNLVYYSKKKKIKRIWNNFFLKKSLFDAFLIAHPTIFLKRKIALKFKYDVSYNISADLDFILRLINNRITYKYFNIFSVAMENVGMSTGFKNFFSKFQEDIKIQKKYFKNYILIFLLQKFNKLKSLRFCNDKNHSEKIIKYVNYLKL